MKSMNNVRGDIRAEMLAAGFIKVAQASPSQLQGAGGRTSADSM